MKNTLLYCVSSARQTSFKFLTHSFALLMLLALGSSSLWAVDITPTDGNSVTISGVTFAPSKSTGQNPPAYYSNGSALRFYQNNKLTISATSSITQIVFASSSNTKFSASTASASVGTFSGNTWTGSATSITFSISSACRITTASVTVGSSKFTITLSRNGVTEQIKDLTSEYTLPSAASEADACTDWVFKGWSTSTVASTTTEPSYVTTASETGTFYAVYGKTETSGGGSTTESVTWSDRYSGTTDVEGVELTIGTNAKVTHNKGSNSNACKYYDTGAGIRVYGGGNFVVTASGSDITAMSLTFGTGEGTNAITANTGTYSNGSWSGKATSVTFSIGGTSGHRRIAGITVTYGGGSSTTTYTTSPECKTLSSIAVTTPPTKTTYTEGESFDPTGMVVTATYTDHSTAPITGYTYSPTGALTVGTSSISISYGGKTTTQSITVNAIPTHTIAWMVNNSSVQSESKKEGVKLNTLTMPSTPADDALSCADKFMGWSRTNLGSALGQDAPSDLFTDISKFPDTELVGSADITFYAVFASVGGAGTSKIWSVGDIVSGGAYYIGGTVSSSDYFLKQRPSDAAEAYKNGSTTDKEQAEILVFTKSGSDWTIKVGDKYVALNNTNASLTYQTSSATFKISDDDGLYLTNNSRQLTLNASATNNFGSYATTFTGGADIWLLPAASYEDYVTSCGKSLSIKPKTLTAERPFVGTGTLTAIANLYTPSGYSWTSSNESVATVSGSGATATVTYHASGTCTITCSAPDGSTPMTATATVIVPASYKVTWDVNGSTTDQYYLLTESPIMPAAPEENCGTKVFVGWTNAPIPTEQAVAPIALYTSQSDFESRKIAATYYAVFADESETSNTYSIINDNSELTSNDYVIEAFYNSKDYALGTNIDTNGKIPGTIVTDNDGEITLAPGQESLVWTITRNEDNVLTFKNKSTDQYLNIVESGSYGKLELGILGDASEYTFTITNNGAGYSNSWIFKSENIKGQQLENYQGVFQSYNNQAAKIYLYKKVLSYTGFTTVCGPTIRVDEYKYIVSGKDITIKSANIPVAGNNLESATLLLVTRKSGSTNLSATLNNPTVSGGVTTDASLVISYHPTAFNTTETAIFEIKDNLDQTSALFEITGISLPEKFVIASKVDDQWFSLPGNMDLFDTYSGVPTTMDNADNPTHVEVVDPIAAYSTMALTNSADVNDRLIHLSSLNSGILCVSSSSSETGIRNYANTHANELNAVSRWTISTLDGVSYTITSASKSSPLRYNRSGNKLWGLYASGSETFRIVPITNTTDECVYLREPMKMKATALASSATLTFKNIPSATNYEYSLNNGSSWNDVASFAENSSDKNYIDAVVDGLVGSTSYTILLRAKSITDVCATPVAASVDIKTAACDDTPLLNGEPIATTTTATISWTCKAATSDIVFYTDDTYSVEATTPAKITGVSSPYTITDLTKNTTYYYKVFAGGTCESVGNSFLTATPEVEVVNWNPNYIDLDLNIDGTPAAVIQKQVTEGSGEDVYADDIFFSKYFEAKGSLKLIGIYNGTAAPVSLEGVIITYVKVADTKTGVTKTASWNKKDKTMTLNLSPLGEIPAKTEYIFYTVTNSELAIAQCIQDAVGWDKNNWFPTDQASADIISEQTGKTIPCKFLGGLNGTTGMKLQFNGTHAVSMWRDDTMIDLIGRGDEDGADGSEIIKAPKGCVKINGEMQCDVPLNDDYGWFCADGIDYETKDSSALSTNRFLLIRKNIVRAGYSTPAQLESMTTHGVGTESAVASNGDNFNTLCTEWEGRAIGYFTSSEEDVVTTCENFNLVSDFNYSNYYTSFKSIGDTVLINEHNQNPDGTFRLYLNDLDSLSCQPLKIKVLNGKGGETVFEREYTVPIMIMSNSTTNSDYFALWNEGNPHSTSTPRTEEECKKCNVVVLDNITLTKDSKVPEVHDITVYPGAQLIVPDGQSLKANTITFRRNNDQVSSAYLYNNSSLDLSATTEVYFNFRLDAKNWYWMTLPYACNIDDVTFSDGNKAIYGTDWFLKYYDGEARAANRSGGWKLVPHGATLEPGVGYIIGIPDDPNPDYQAELRFPMAKYSEQGTKNVGVRNWGEDKADPEDYQNIQSYELTPNNKGWQLVGNPFFAFNQNSLSGQDILKGSLSQVSLEPNGYTFERSGTNRYITTTSDHGSSYTQVLASSQKLAPFTAYFVQVGVGTGTSTPVADYSLAFNATERTQDKAAATPARRMLMHAEDEQDNINTDEPVFVGLSIIAPNGEQDETALAINDQYELDKYEMGVDLMKWKGDAYTRLKKPLIYTMAGTNERSFNAMARKECEQMIPVGFYAYNTDVYTVHFNPTYTEYLGSIEELTLYDAVMNTYTDLLKYDYTFVPTKKGDCKDRLFIIAKIAERIDVQTGMGKASILTNETCKFVTPDGQLHVARDGVIYDAQGRIEQVIR